MDSNPGISLFQPGAINVENVQNVEEEEDLEDQKKRQEEIQSLLTKAMDDFNYDDQSTINSSTNVSMDERRYKDASMDDQLKVLYEVRVREVRSLTVQMEELKAQMAEQKDGYVKRYLLAEAERERAQLSLTQAQELLVLKTQEVTQLHQEIENVQRIIEDINAKVRALEEERDSLKHSNCDLMEQLKVSQRGLPVDTLTERQLQEIHRVEVAKLQSSLEIAHKKIERKEGENKELQQQLREKVREKDEVIVEKSDVVNRLTESLEDAQQQCREMMQLVETLNQENIKLKHNSSNFNFASGLQADLADKMEIIKVLQKELEKAHEQQNKHLLEYKRVQENLSEVTKNYAVSESEGKKLKEENGAIKSGFELVEGKMRELETENAELKQELQECSDARSQNKVLTQRVAELQKMLTEKHCGTDDRSVQVSQFLDDNSKTVAIEMKLEEALRDNEGLTQQLLQYEQVVQSLKSKVSLERERENLIVTLQDKAAQFERVLAEQQERRSTETVGVNTEEFLDQFELLRAKCEAELIEKEIKLRLELEAEFDRKLDKALQEQAVPRQEQCSSCTRLVSHINEINANLRARLEELAALKCSSSKQCQNCSQAVVVLESKDALLRSQAETIEGMKAQQMKDRDAVARVLECWQEKFKYLEVQNEQLVMTLAGREKNGLETRTQLEEAERDLGRMRAVVEEMRQKLELREQGDVHLARDIKIETKRVLQEWNKRMYEKFRTSTAEQHSKVLEIKNRIDQISIAADSKVQEIENIYVQKRHALRIQY